MLFFLARCCIAFVSGAGVLAQESPQESPWIRPASPDAPLIWGRRDGVVFGLPSPGGIRGPRGLIRVGPWSKGDLQNELLNFIAVEPIVAGAGNRYNRAAFSELEMSELDPGQQGKRLWVDGGGGPDAYKGKLETIHVGRGTVERLSVRIDIERFTINGAHVYLIASIDSDQRDEVRLSVFAEKDSPPLQEIGVSATMGNYERLRLLWLNGSVESSWQLFGDYMGNRFVEGGSYPLPQLLRNNDGDAVVYATSDEADPGASPGNATAHWPYTLPKLTQYWRIPGYEVQPDLRARVNARRVYWNSDEPVPGGIAFENFETRQRYIPGQSFIFGVSTKNPWELYQGSAIVRPYNRGHYEY
ncbi:hypothetical protein SAMN05421770_102494 [Granulicella rosea]|uniref:Methane oxygenase PmoA n=1 Tax=Granulicella rosea TaxID=474952 RepID=A0A239HSJ1_9BACT|nr:hypothetical protein [Granulicella rosea]SNS83254.1 hypothetical protein SAMN05421770_102494 [Granulicella rosea]